VSFSHRQMSKQFKRCHLFLAGKTVPWTNSIGWAMLVC